MNLDFSPETETFRQTVRTFFETDFPKDILEKNRAGHALTTAEVRKSEMALGAKGWLASAWPEEYGGPGWSVEEQYVFDEELERAGVPTVTPMGVVYVGPVLYTFGSDLASATARSAGHRAIQSRDQDQTSHRSSSAPCWKTGPIR